jgi:hypothetical protein
LVSNALRASCSSFILRLYFPFALEEHPEFPTVFEKQSVVGYHVILFEDSEMPTFCPVCLKNEASSPISRRVFSAHCSC